MASPEYPGIPEYKSVWRPRNTMSAELIAVYCADVQTTVVIVVDLDFATCSSSTECAAATRDCKLCSSTSSCLPIEKSQKGRRIRNELRRIKKCGGRIGVRTFKGDTTCTQNDVVPEDVGATFQQAEEELWQRIEQARVGSKKSTEP